MTPTATATVTATATIVSWPNVCRGCSCQWQNGSRSTRGAARRSVVRLLSNRAGRVAVVVARVLLPFSLQVFHVSRSVSLPKCLILFIRSFSFDKNVNSNVFNVCVPSVCLYTPKYETVNCPFRPFRFWQVNLNKICSLLAIKINRFLFAIRSGKLLCFCV